MTVVAREKGTLVPGFGEVYREYSQTGGEKKIDFNNVLITWVIGILTE
jgi:hypothetical protein